MSNLGKKTRNRQTDKEAGGDKPGKRASSQPAFGKGFLIPRSEHAEGSSSAEAKSGPACERPVSSLRPVAALGSLEVSNAQDTVLSNYFLKIIQLLDDYPRCFIVGTDNVGSRQMQQIRMPLRGKAVVLMGKNTMMRKAIRGHLENNPVLEELLPHIRGNVGFVFTKEDLTEIRDMLLANKVPAAACAGAIAPCEVTVPAQNTGLGPEKTSFFQALGITTKISRGTIEILSDVQLMR
ncbi:60S acidic ribosomal protein P0-like [Sorex fumeus]|uniref:60S acidic ribosomal protein P0-like n=1 Tax=Sorex fumeus TaxID=62283 RepID=UPI0024ADEDB1|nr:60S acidic ribosomal protein P0-like [Sorex fumeus]